MIISGPLCPMPGDGRHKLKAIYDGSGFACAACSKTWRWAGKELEESFRPPPTEES